MIKSNTIAAWSVSLSLALLLSPAAARACSTVFNETWALGGSAQWSGLGNECALEASVAMPSPAAATVHFRRQLPAEPLRMSFRVTPPEATWNTLSAFTIARGTAERVPAGGPAEASLFQLILSGNLPGTAVRMYLVAACSSEASGMCSTVVAEPVTFPLRVTVELQIGEGKAGRLLYWAGDASAEPTATLENLDNSRWGGVERVSLGLSDVGDQLASLLDGRVVVFDDILVDERSLFWSDFELGTGHPVPSNQPPLLSPPYVVTGGNTCGGADALPVLASGSTSVRGPKDIYPFAFVLGDGAYRTVSITSALPRMQVFVCEDAVSTTSRCLTASRAGSSALNFVQPGSYQIVVGDGAGGCGAYSLHIAGPLGRWAD